MCVIPLSSLITRLLRRSPLFPYTTLFRSLQHAGRARGRGRPVDLRHPLHPVPACAPPESRVVVPGDRKSTRLNSSHLVISYAVFCLKKKNTAREILRFFRSGDLQRVGNHY